MTASSSTRCTRCGRGLKDPTSLKRGMGPLCWAASNGPVFEKDLEADDKEWARREQVLQAGGEIDLGCNWSYIPEDRHNKAICVPLTMRVSVRFRDGQFEAYGFLSAGEREIIFGRSEDLREVYAAAVAAGPQANATTHRMRQASLRRMRSVIRAVSVSKSMPLLQSEMS